MGEHVIGRPVRITSTLADENRVTSKHKTPRPYQAPSAGTGNEKSDGLGLG